MVACHASNLCYSTSSPLPRVFLVFQMAFLKTLTNTRKSWWPSWLTNLQIANDNYRVVPNSRHLAELTGYLGLLCRLLSWYICIFKDKLFVPLLALIYENETYFPLQFIDLKIICSAQRYMIIRSLRWVLGLNVESHWRHEFIQIKLKSYDYFWNWHYWKFVLRIKEILFLGT